ncbi:MAG: hypothetical protein HY578_02025 [Nitrospinae bacterium]|nr:hypothetical protein [Nitrospinota bacterium]
MASRLKRTLLNPISYILPDSGGNFITRLFSKSLQEELFGKITDKFLEILLYGMDFGFCISKGFRKNILVPAGCKQGENFKGRYLFMTADNLVSASAVFNDGNMTVYKEEIADWNVRITFKNAAALRAFLFSKNQDILNSLLANEVEVDGNLNYIYKFGFMARDLSRRLGVG